MKKAALYLLIGLLALAALYLLAAYLFSDKTGPTPSILRSWLAESAPAPTPLRFEVVDTEATRDQGLGNRASIPDNYAMLFVFQTPDRYGFWMKDMLVPIDIVWLTDAGDIMLIDASVAPETYPHIFYPPAAVKYVLETRAGYAADHGWKVGSHVELPAPYGHK